MPIAARVGAVLKAAQALTGLTQESFEWTDAGVVQSNNLRASRA
ncbi:hypothetical protein [Gloeocapsopsis dulcis]|nr:hypothetical protein [Gloeocapsopsis dulcis]